MSSHHIVRDEQEPALIIHRLDSFPMELLNQLLEWSPTVICCGPALDDVLKLGIKMDIVILPFEWQERYQEDFERQLPLKVITISQPDYMSTGLQILVKEGYRAVNVVTKESLTPEVLDLALNYCKQMDLVIYNELERNVICGKPQFEKWLPAESQLTVMSLQSEGELSSTGFDEDIDDEFDSDYELEKTKEGQVEIKCTHPPFLIIEPLTH
ncbi:MAG: hypothetical protein KI790_09675 [Cyclobacteriaceae bacterium]|nr:hypothetical protein [Cyclobacteriaceae bacterium HetDA_MAG_MS6]